VKPGLGFGEINIPIILLAPAIPTSIGRWGRAELASLGSSTPQTAPDPPRSGTPASPPSSLKTAKAAEGSEAWALRGRRVEPLRAFFPLASLA